MARFLLISARTDFTPGKKSDDAIAPNRKASDVHTPTIITIRTESKDSTLNKNQ